jgi:hypothetical protein
MILQVHDELVFEVREQDQEAVAAVVKDVMENACEPTIKLSGSEYSSFLVFPPGLWETQIGECMRVRASTTCMCDRASTTSCHFTPHPIAPPLMPVLNHLPTHCVQCRWLSMWELARIGRLHTDQILRRKTPGRRTGERCFCKLQGAADVFCSSRGEFSTAERLSCGEFGEEIGKITCWFLLIYNIEIRNPSTGP